MHNPHLQETVCLKSSGKPVPLGRCLRCQDDAKTWFVEETLARDGRTEHRSTPVCLKCARQALERAGRVEAKRDHAVESDIDMSAPVYRDPDGGDEHEYVR